SVKYLLMSARFTAAHVNSYACHQPTSRMSTVAGPIAVHRDNAPSLICLPSRVSEVLNIIITMQLPKQPWSHLGVALHGSLDTKTFESTPSHRCYLNLYDGTLHRNEQ